MRRFVLFHAISAMSALAAVSGCTLDFDRFEPLGDAGGDVGGGIADTRVADTRVDTNVVAEDTAPLDASVADASTPDVSAPEVPTTCEGTTFGGHCYFALQAAANWNKARNECATRGAHLVTIASEAEQTFVDGLSQTAPRWIGLRRMGGVFQWITNEPVTFTRWGTGEPKGAGDCARLRPANDWSEEDCKGEVGTICERD